MPGPADVILKRFEAPDEVREMELGRFAVFRLGGRTMGRTTDQPGSDPLHATRDPIRGHATMAAP